MKGFLGFGFDINNRKLCIVDQRTVDSDDFI